MDKTKWANPLWHVSPWDYYPEVTKDFTFANRVRIHEVTLRDGEQETGVCFSAQDKIDIAKKLAALGVDSIEAGMPAVSASDEYAVKSIAGMNLGPKIFAFARCMVGDVEMAKKAGCDGVVTEIAANKEYVEKAYGKSYEWAKKAAIDATKAAHELGMKVAFFTIDGTRAPIDQLLDMVDEVQQEGHMDSFVLADTFGVATPQAIFQMTKRIKARFKQPFEAHCHNHFGLGTANTLAAIAAGADVVHVTVAGLGEGSGNTAIEEVVMGMKCLYGLETRINTELFCETAKFVCAKANNHAIPVNRPFLGEHIYTCESGIGVMFCTNCTKANDVELAMSYHPALVGQKHLDFAMGKKSGTYTVYLWLERIGRTATEQQVNAILAKVKDLAVREQRLLSEAEFVVFVNEVLGPPTGKEKRGTPVLDQQSRRAGEAWLAEKAKEKKAA